MKMVCGTSSKSSPLKDEDGVNRLAPAAPGIRPSSRCASFFSSFCTAAKTVVQIMAMPTLKRSSSQEEEEKE